MLFFEAEHLKKINALSMDRYILLNLLVIQLDLLESFIKWVPNNVVQQFMNDLKNFKESNLSFTIIIVLLLETNLKMHETFTAYILT